MADNMSKSMQIEFSEEEDQLIELYKATHRLRSKAEAVRQMVKGYEKADKPISKRKDAKI